MRGNDRHRILPNSLAKKILLFKELNFKELKEKIQKVTNLKLDGYREEYLFRRISYHFNKADVNSMEEYFQLLAQKKEFVNELLDCITVNLSYFFRDKHSFEFLQNEILPELISRYSHLRIWSMGCSIGAEIYSIALILDYLKALYKAELIATDTDQGALLQAIGGKYSPNDLKHLPDIYKKYFKKLEGERVVKPYEVDQDIKDSVTFLKHDLTSGLPLSGTRGMRRYHLLVCRNVMIYFSHEVKENLYQLFYEWLEPGGVLFIGANEIVIGPAKEKFKRIQSQFYRKPLY